MDNFPHSNKSPPDVLLPSPLQRSRASGPINDYESVCPGFEVSTKLECESRNPALDSLLSLVDTCVCELAAKSEGDVKS